MFEYFSFKFSVLVGLVLLVVLVVVVALVILIFLLFFASLPYWLPILCNFTLW